MNDRRKPHVPNWKEVVDRVNMEELSGGEFLVSGEGGACTIGEVSVFCGDSYATTLPIVHYILEQIAFKKDPVFGNDILVLSRVSEQDFLKKLAFSMAGINCWQMQYELRAKSVCSEYRINYENACAKIESSNLSVRPSDVTMLEDLDDIVSENEGNAPRLIIIDDLLSCRCRGCHGDVHGWNMVGNRLNHFAHFHMVPIVAMMPVPRAQSCYRAFEDYGLLRNYIDLAYSVSIGRVADETDDSIRSFSFELLFSPLHSNGCVGDFAMKYNARTHRIFD